MASGDTLLGFIALSAEPPAANPATFNLRNEHPLWEFDGGSAEQMVFSAVMPQAYDGGGVSVFLWVAVDGTGGDLDFDVEFERGTGQDIDADSFAAAQSTDGTAVPGTSGVRVQIEIAFADGAEMDSVVAGDPFRIRVTRQGGDDANNDDAQLLEAEIREA
jgi:hypothetical protein